MAMKIKWDKARKSFNSLPSKITIKPDMFTKSKQKTLGHCLHIGMWLFTKSLDKCYKKHKPIKNSIMTSYN